MKKLMLPVILAVVGLVGGAGAGWFLKPPPPPEPCYDDLGEEQPVEACEKADHEDAHAEDGYAPEDEAEHATPSEFVEMDRQFVIPVMGERKVHAFVLIQASVEVDPGSTDAVISRMPRVRDAFLRDLFDHAYAGGFDGAFTAEYVMRDLRANLLRSARRIAGPTVRAVLITDIVRQDQ
jgi:hypothetical protein